MNVGKFICNELRSHLSNFYFRLSVPWHVSFSDLHYGMCELKIPLRTLLEHPDFELFARFAEMDTNRAHPIRFISDPGSKIWGEFQRFVKNLARLLPQATDLEGFRTCGPVSQPLRFA